MSAELIAILAVGVALAGLLATSQRNLRNDLRTDIQQVRTDIQQVRTDIQQVRTDVRALETRVAAVEQGQAKLEGLLEGLREAITGRRGRSNREDSPSSSARSSGSDAPSPTATCDSGSWDDLISGRRSRHLQEERMDRKTFLIAAVAVFVVYKALDALIHGVLLADAWTASGVLRPDADMMSKMWIMWLTGLLWSFIFVYLFHSVRQGPGVMEGVRYGFCIGLFVMVPTAYNSYATLPIAHSLALAYSGPS